MEGALGLGCPVTGGWACSRPGVALSPQVHMGTHMWNNAPARRAARQWRTPWLCWAATLKFSEMFQKDLAARAMNVDPSLEPVRRCHHERAGP